MAIGENVNAKKEDTISVGSSNNSNTGGGITIGKGNTADSTAMVVELMVTLKLLSAAIIKRPKKIL